MRHPWAGLILTSEVSLRFQALVGSWHETDMVACLAEVRYAIISGDALAVGLSFIHSSLQTGSICFTGWRRMP
jgi:hypothetical protein